MNQYTQTPFDDREYDANGNLTAVHEAGGEDLRFTYDYRDRPVRVSDASGVEVARYLYDALGRRIERRATVPAAGTETVRYFYAGLQVCEERDAAGATTATYVYGRGIDEPVEAELAGNSYWFHCDELYSTVALTDAGGDVVERYDYGDFGTPAVLNPDGTERGQSAVGNPYLYAGRRFDPETGHYYLRARYLEPQAGRFTTRDPIGLWGDPPNLGNAYTYAGNNPETRRDPMGTRQLTPDEERQVVCEFAAQIGLDGGAEGGVICFGGKKYPCVWGPTAGYMPEVQACVLEHESEHTQQADCPEECDLGAMRRLRLPSHAHDYSECVAFILQAECAIRNARRLCPKLRGRAQSQCWRQFKEIAESDIYEGYCRAIGATLPEWNLPSG